MDKLRLFWAINLPERLKHAVFNGIIAPLQKIPADIKWVEQQNLHLTLLFLGDVDSRQVDDLVNSVNVRVSNSGPLKLEVKGAGCFPAEKRPRVLWAGLSGEIERLKVLQGEIEAVHKAAGFSPGNKSFSPHLTLGRFRSPANSRELLQKAHRLAPASQVWGTFRAETVDLMQSSLSRQGSSYKILASVQL